MTHGEALPEAPIAEVPILAELPLALRSDIYGRALELLPLRAEALRDLTARGLTAEQAHEMGYRSIPHRGPEHQELLAGMNDQFGDDLLSRCPGFTDKNGRRGFWTASTTRDGYVVPYRDGEGRITGLQLKLLGGRYLTATGAKLDGVYHVAGEAFGADLYLTEGATKANVAHILGGDAVFAVAGQSLRPRHIDAITLLSPRRVIVALDEERNTRTDQARDRWLRALVDAGLPTARAVWEGADVGGPKGLDDLLLSGHRPRVRGVAFAPSELGSRHEPHPTEAAGPIDAGMSLQDARAQTRRAIDAFVGRAAANAGTALLVTSSPGAGKSTALASAIGAHRTPARVLVGTKRLAVEQAEQHGYVLVEGRHPGNCERSDVVERLAEAGHDVERLACGTAAEPRCPLRVTCGYWAQFSQPGPRVAAAEQLFNPHFLAGGTLIALDDAELLRSAIERSTVSGATLSKAIDQLDRRRREPLRALLGLVLHAVTDAPERPLIGPAVWDHVANTAARQSQSLGAMLRALPAQPTLPAPNDADDGLITPAAIDRVPPPLILRIVEALRSELDDFEAGVDFNSRIRLSCAGIEVWAPREPVPDRHGKPLAPQMALLVLDATPVEALVAHVVRDHTRLDDVRLTIRLPENVTVAQYASSTNGHAVLAVPDRLRMARSEVARERAEHPVGRPDAEALIAFKRHVPAFVDDGWHPSQVLSFGSLRGTNTLATAERLHIVGRPMPPTDDIAFLAQAIHRSEAPVSPQLQFTSRTYGGQRVVIDVLDFADPRPAALLRATREDELTQVIHRARLLTLEPQAAFEPTAQRDHVRVVLHTSHVVPGLRVDELHLPETGTALNDQRARDAERRIQTAIAALIARGDQLTDSSVAREAGAHRRTVAKVLGTGVQTLKGADVAAAIPREAIEVGTPVQTVSSDLNKGVHTLPKSGQAPRRLDPPARRRADNGVCRGGCGTPMPPGQKCVDCATAAVARWSESRRRLFVKAAA